MLKELVHTYFESPDIKLSDKLWLPHTNIGLHWTEMDPQLISNVGENFLKRAKKVAQSVALNPQTSQERLYARIYDDVINGRAPKREFRLHFNSMVDFTFSRKGKIYGLNLKLISATKNALLFYVPREHLRYFTLCPYCELRMDLSDIFRSPSEEITGHFRAFKPLRNKKMLQRIQHQNFHPINLAETKFFDSLVARSRFGPRFRGRYLFVPYESIQDVLHMGTSSVGPGIRENIETVEKDFNQLVI
jgi:hypothetical protein